MIDCVTPIRYSKRRRRAVARQRTRTCDKTEARVLGGRGLRRPRTAHCVARTRAGEKGVAVVGMGRIVGEKVRQRLVGLRGGSEGVVMGIWGVVGGMWVRIVVIVGEVGIGVG
jgi:hypothetical protein